MDLLYAADASAFVIGVVREDSGGSGVIDEDDPGIGDSAEEDRGTGVIVGNDPGTGVMMIGAAKQDGVEEVVTCGNVSTPWDNGVMGEATAMDVVGLVPVGGKNAGDCWATFGMAP